MKKRKRFSILKLFFVVLVVVFLIFALFNLVGKLANQIVIIPVNGMITSDTSFNIKQTSSAVIVDYIEKANKNPSIKGILLVIDSPGGSVIASKEIADAVKESKKPTVAFIRGLGTSGAYWVASAADKVVADPMSVVGSIGVSSSYLEFSGFMEKYGITYEKITSGKYKDLGSPYRKLSDEERNLLQERIDEIYAFFVNEVSENRGLGKDRVKELGKGLFYLGREAKEIGLVDYLGNKRLAVDVVKELAGIKKARLVKFVKKRSLFEFLNKFFSEVSFALGRGVGYELKSNRNNILPLYSSC